MQFEMTNEILQQTLNDCIALAMLVPARQMGENVEDVAHRGLRFTVMRERVKELIDQAREASAKATEAALADAAKVGG